MSEDQKSAARVLEEEIAATLANRSQGVKDLVLEHLVSEKLAERKNLVLAGLTKLREAKSALQKTHKNSTKQFISTGEVASEYFTQEQVKAIKEATEQVKKIETALEEALAESKYDKLQNIVKSGGKEQPKE